MAAPETKVPAQVLDEKTGQPTYIYGAGTEAGYYALKDYPISKWCDVYIRLDIYTAAQERIAELESEAKASHIFHEGHESQMEYLRERMAELERQGYTLAMRLLQSDIVLDDVETAARNALLNSWRTPSE